MADWLRNLPNRSVTFQAALLGTVVIAVFVIVTPVALCASGPVGLAAAAAAAILCLTGTVAALTAGRLLRGPSRVLAAFMTGMAARMGVPLAFGLAIHLQGGPLAKGGLLYYLLVFYPVTLAVETMLSLPAPQRSDQSISETINR